MDEAHLAEQLDRIGAFSAFCSPDSAKYAKSGDPMNDSVGTYAAGAMEDELVSDKMRA